MLKKLFFLLSILTAQFCSANMASPIIDGTYASSAFSSKDIDILHENIVVRINKNFQTAKFSIEYFIKSDVEGKQIPLLFFAKDYKEKFRVWVDDEEVKISDIPDKYLQNYDTIYQNFSNAFAPKNDNNGSKQVVIKLDNETSQAYRVYDLTYFEANLVKGEHKIRVEYIANAWIDNSDWVKEYSFRYSLSPAKNWRSFGGLNISVLQDGDPQPLSTNLGLPIEGKIEATANWKFDKLPADFFQIIYKPTAPALAKALIAIEPFWLMIILAVLLFALHVLATIWYRKRYNDSKYNWIVIPGIIILPFVVLLSYTYWYSLIDDVIGQDAGRHHGYSILNLFFYPFIVPLYWFLMWMIDKRVKRNLLAFNKNDI